MAKTSSELLAQAKKLIAEAKKKEEQEAIKIGKLVLKLFHKQEIHDDALIEKINSIIGKIKEG